MARTHKHQHYVPKGYLSAWTDPDTPVHMTPFVWTFPRAGGEGKAKSPGKLFTETDMYTIPRPDGGRDLRIEHGLNQLETGLIMLREQFIERQRQIPEPRFLKFIAFIAAMHGRTPGFRNHQKEQWGKVLEKLTDAERSVAKMSPEQRKRTAGASLSGSGPKMYREDVERLANYPVQSLLSSVLRAEVPILSQMVMTIYWTDERPGFITSDEPVVWFDPEGINRPPLYRGPALMYETVEITMPLSPRHLIALHHDQPMSRGIKPVKYEKAWPQTVLAMNRRTVWHSRSTIVSSGNSFDRRWMLPAGEHTRSGV